MGAQHAQLNIGDFDLGDGRRYRVYADPDWAESDDSVTVSRVHPDPARGKGVMDAKNLDSPHPAFHFPGDWSESDQDTATHEILRLWRTDWRAPQFIWDTREAVQLLYIGARRIRLLRPPGIVAVTAELTHHDGRAPTWAATFYRLDRGPGSNYGLLMRISWTCMDWLGKTECDRVGAEARRRLRDAAWGLWMFAPK